MQESMPPKFDDVASFYNDIYYGNADATAAIAGERHLRALARRLTLHAGQNLLDVACGTGDWLTVASRLGLSVAGADISERAIAVCRKRLPHGTFHVGPAERLDFPDDTFDVISCLGSLEHFLDQKAALREMIRVLKPAGRIVLLVPNAGFLPYRLGWYKGTQQQSIRETIRSLDAWRELFAECGLLLQARWRDLHVLNWGWIVRRPWMMLIPRLIQSLLLPLWPLRWQYQVFHLYTPDTAATCGTPAR